MPMKLKTETLPQRLRAMATTLRTKNIPLATIIPLLQQAADQIEAGKGALVDAERVLHRTNGLWTHKEQLLRIEIEELTNRLNAMQGADITWDEKGDRVVTAHAARQELLHHRQGGDHGNTE